MLIPEKFGRHAVVVPLFLFKTALGEVPQKLAP